MHSYGCLHVYIQPQQPFFYLYVLQSCYTSGCLFTLVRVQKGEAVNNRYLKPTSLLKCINFYLCQNLNSCSGLSVCPFTELTFSRDC